MPGEPWLFGGLPLPGGISLKIRGKINLLVAVMAGAALLIGATALYAVDQYDRQLQAYELAASRAYMGERLNRYVTAVVMESRGIYAVQFRQGCQELRRWTDE